MAILKRTIILIMCGVFIMTCTYGCKKNKEDKGTLVDVNIEPTPEPLSLKIVRDDKQIVCGDRFTVAITMSGDVLTTGNCGGLYRELEQIYGAYKITAGSGVLGAVMGDGSVRIIGENADEYSEALEWQNMIDLSFGNNFLIGLCADGMLYACGNNAQGCCNISDLHRVVKIAAGENQMAAVLHNGTVVTKGIYKNENEIDEWKDVRDVVCGRDFIVAVCNDGTVKSFKNDAVSDWKNVHDIKAWGSEVAALTEEGEIITTADFGEEFSEIEKVDAFGLGEGFIALMCNEKVECFGVNDDLQCDTSWWNLGVTIDKGYITGFAENTSVDTAKQVLEKKLEKQVEFINAADDEAFIGELIGTGVRVKADGETVGTVLIYGDLNGDGRISDTDKTILDEYLQTKENLKGSFLKAAYVGHYASDTNALSAVESSLIAAHIKGSSHIKQYVNDPFADSFKKWDDINSDVVGYVRVDGTRIDNPILYGGKYYYYHNHNIYGDRSGVGAIYSIYPQYCKNNIVIGHNARGSGRMFHDLHKLQNRGENLLVYKNRVINLTLYHEYSQWELYALYETGPNEPIDTQKNNIKSLEGFTDEQIRAWIDGQIARSEVDLGVKVDTDDTFLTMYTCGDDYYSDENSQSRLYLFFRRVG